MIINGAHIQGIFKYDNNLSFEKGDFVIYDGMIFICTAINPTDPYLQVVRGIIPTEDGINFKVYLGDKITSVQEYLDYVSSPETSEDKYISSHTLSGILNHYMFGLDERGIIKEYIQYNSSSGITLSKGLTEIISNVGESGVLGEIIRSNSLNNAVIMISATLPEIYTLDGDPMTDYIILRQTTYINGDEVRIQELINPVKGKVWWRATAAGNWNSITSWKSSFYSDQVKKELDYLYNYYQKKVTELEDLKLGMERVWKYESMNITRTSTLIIQNNNPSGQGYLPVPAGCFERTPEAYSLNESLILQLCYRKRVSIGSDLWTTGSIIIDLRDSLIDTEAQVLNYQTSNGVIFSVVIEDENTINIGADTTDGTGCVIYSVYYRKIYE